MRILVIDDSEDGRDIAEAMLLSAGYEHVSTAGSAAEAYRFLGIGGQAEPVAIDLLLLGVDSPAAASFVKPRMARAVDSGK